MWTMRSSYSTAFCGVSDHAPISFCPLNPHSSPGITLTVLTADAAIMSSAYFLNAAAGSSGVCAMVTVAAIPAGRSPRPPPSPGPAAATAPAECPGARVHRPLVGYADGDPRRLRVIDLGRHPHPRFDRLGARN